MSSDIGKLADALGEIGNKPETIAQCEGENTGLLRFTPAGWTEVLSIGAGRVPMHAVLSEQPWGEIDSADDFAVHEG